jgi:uncharacterized membrane protein
MLSLYFILKFIHVAAVIAWIGAILSLNITAIRAARSDNPAVLKELLGSITFTGQRVIGPGSGIALLAGIWMVINAKIGFMTPWVLWGMAGFLFHFVIGATVLRKNGMELGRIAAMPAVDQAALERVRYKQKTIAVVYLLVMLTVIWAMVTKPTF